MDWEDKVPEEGAPNPGWKLPLDLTFFLHRCLGATLKIWRQEFPLFCTTKGGAVETIILCGHGCVIVSLGEDNG